MSDTSVHYFHSGMAGAPVMSGSAGSLIGVLDACLVNGWGTQTVDSIVIAGGVATVTRSAGQPFEVDVVAEIAGAVVSGGSVNGKQKVLSATSTSYTFDATGIPNQTATTTGSITHRFAAAGWGKPFSATNIAVYRSADVTSTRFFLRLDDSPIYNALPRAYETMADANTGTNPFPTVAQQDGSNYKWPRSAQTDSSPQTWAVFANERVFYIALGHYASSYPGAHSLVGFGDFAKVGSNDVFSCFIGATSTGGPNVPGNSNTELDWQGQGGYIYTARDYHGFGGSISHNAYYPVFRLWTTTGRSGDPTPTHIPFPNDSDGSVYLTPWHLCSNANAVYRGRLPGFFSFPQRIGPSNFTNGSRISGVVGYAGKRFAVYNSYSGCFAFDVSGPWT